MSPRKQKCGIVLAFVLGLAPVYVSQADDPPLKTQYYKGKVTPLADILAKEGAKLDADASASWMALVSEDGKIYPLIKDSASRMFFKDVKLLNRPMRLTGRLIPGSGIVQVVNVHSYVNGKLHDIYYWCDICTIKRFEAGICECCGGPMELREVPVDVGPISNRP